MPSSLIFAGLVVLWLLILVPAVARRQQEVARLSPAALSGRVLERPMRHRIPEVVMTERRDDGGTTTVGDLARQRDDVPSPREADEVDDRSAGPRDTDTAVRDGDIDDELDRELDRDEIDRVVDDELDHEDDDGWEPAPESRYRPGRGGFDPEAAAATAHAKYAFRQRLVLALLVLLLGAGACALLVSDVFWWAAGALGVALAGYLTYLRRQVRIEEEIRARRTQRLTGARRPVEVDEPEFDDEPVRDARPSSGGERAGRAADTADDTATETAVEDDDTTDEDWTADDGQTGRIRGTGEPLGVLPARCRTVDGPGSTEHASSLPRLTAAATPPIPTGTSLVDVDDEDELDAAYGTGDHRRASGE